MKTGLFSLLLCRAVFNDVSLPACMVSPLPMSTQKKKEGGLWAEAAWLMLHTPCASHAHSGLSAMGAAAWQLPAGFGDSQGKRKRETRLEVVAFSVSEIKAALETSLGMKGDWETNSGLQTEEISSLLFSLSLHVAPLYFNAKCFLNSSWGDYLHIIMWSNEGKGMLCKAIASCPLLLSARAKHISCHLFNSISWCS